MEERKRLYKPSPLRNLRESGAWHLLVYAFLVLFIGNEAYAFRIVSYEILLGLMALALALALGAGVELRFYELKLQLRNIERLLLDIKAEETQQSH
jgi:hypothetical protein